MEDSALVKGKKLPTAKGVAEYGYNAMMDPQGQMLAAMLLAQEKNADGKYLYGCYVVEKNWHFTSLKDLDYCVSRQFDSSQKHDLLQIVFTLRKLKELIINR